MSTRNLDQLLNPSSLAVVGASSRPESVGAMAWRHVRAGHFKGAVYAVNPHYRRLDGQAVYASVDALPHAPDLALVCTPAQAVPGIVAKLGGLGTRAVLVLSAGLDAAQRQATLDAARPHVLRVLGPHSVGLLAPHLGLNASLLPGEVAAGELAFVSQSNALASVMLDWARARGIGMSQVVALGDRADVDAGDLLDHLASDVRTRSILLYLEDVASPRKFLSAARAAARNKPVIVVRGGASSESSAAGADRIYGAAFARAGMLRVDTLQQMFLAAETLARFRANRSEALAIVSNGAGAGTMASDAARRADVPLATLAEATHLALQPLLAQTSQPGGALVLDEHAPAERHVQALRLLQDDPAAPALLLVHAPSAFVSSAQVARAVLPLATQPPPRVLGCWLGDAAVAEARRVFREAGVAHYATPEEAVDAFAMLAAYRRNQAQLIEAPPSSSAEIAADAAAARALVQHALGHGRRELDAHELQRLLGNYGITLAARHEVALEPYAAASAAERVGYPVALRLKVEGNDDGAPAEVLHLDLRTAVQVRDAAQRMLSRWRRRPGRPRATGLVVQHLPQLMHARPLLVGTRIDPLFGPVILFGQGPTLEAAADVAVALPPLNLPLARALVQRTRAARLLQAHGEVPAADEGALLRVLTAVSQLLIDVSQLEALELGPLLVGPGGAVAMQASVRLDVRAPSGALNFAIRPYPSHLVEQLVWHGQPLTVRPIRPEDEAQHMRFLASLDPSDIRMRVFYSRRSIERSELARLAQIDYAREMALIAVEPDPAGGERTLGVVRAICDPDNVRAEFGIVVRSDMKGRRLGELLMRQIIDYQRQHGTVKLVGTVLPENGRMLELARRLGFSEHENRDGSGTRYVELLL